MEVPSLEFEVIIPMHQKAFGEVDQDLLHKAVDGSLQPGGSLGNSASRPVMTFYTQNEPILTMESFSELKGTKMLEKVENSVFWLDVLEYDLEIMGLLAKV